MKYTSLFYLVSSLTVVSLLGFGCNPAAKLQEKMGEKVAEKMIETSAGGNADVDLEDGKVTFKNNKTGESMAFGEDVKIPDDFPQDILLYPNAKAAAVISAGQNNEHTTSVSLHTTDKAADVVTWYEQHMKDAGWMEEQSMTSGSVEIRAYEKEKVKISLTIMSNSDGQGGSNIMVARSEEK